MKTKWSQNDMAMAVRAVREKNVPLQRAATQFKVPRNTLRYRINNDIPLEELKFVQRGPTTALNRSDEDSLANFVVYLERNGFMLDKIAVNDFAWAMAKKEGTHCKFNMEAGPGKQWWAGFRQRHPEVCIWKPRRSLPQTQVNVTMKNKLKRHSKILERILDENNLKDKRKRIFNCGESGVEVDIASQKIGSCDTRPSRTKEHISVQLCVAASGEVLPPFIIFKGKCPPKGQCILNGPSGTVYASSKTGYLTSDLYFHWFKNIFLKYVHTRPVVLIQEGTSCHLTPEIVECAQENQVILYCIPTGTSLVLQPLEVSVMEPLKEKLRKVVSDLREIGQEPDLVITRANFAMVFREPFNNAMTKHVIRKGFKKTGICPWDPERIGIKTKKPNKMSKDVHQAENEGDVMGQTALEQVTVASVDVPEPVTGEDDQIIEIISNDENTDVLVYMDPVFEMVICTSTEPGDQSEIIECSEIVEHSISSDDLDDFLDEEEDKIYEIGKETLDANQD